MATIPVKDLSSEDETSLTKIRARPIPREKRRATSHANNERNGIDSSIKIIEMHSEPEMNTENDSSSDSEIMADFLTTDRRNDVLKINAETCDSILNDSTSKEQLTITKVIKIVAKDEQNDLFHGNNNIDSSFKHDDPIIHNVSKTSTEGKTNLEKDRNQNISSEIEKTSNERTPLKNNLLKPSVVEVWSTPTKNITSMRKQQDSSIRQPSGKENKYKHVMSPVAMYIKGSLRDDGHFSLSPRFKEKPGSERCNKENTQPQIVYRTPTQTGLVTCRKIFPMKQLIKSTSSSSSSVVIRIHTHAEGTPKKQTIPQHDAANESLVPQADLSIHIINNIN